MRVIQIRRSRVLKFAVGSFFGLCLLALIYSHFAVHNMDEPIHPSARKGGRSSGGSSGQRVAHQSHPNEIPVFLGLKNPGNFEPTKDDIIRPKKGAPGENGKSHRLKVEQKTEEERLKGVYGFNQLVSDEISLNRSIPDLREDECRSWDYPTDLPTASVVLVQHNEGWSTLFRTINSVINRSPPQFLKEVVVVDDKSELDHLHEKFETEIQKPYYKKVVLVRNKEREGLIRSRNNGALAATGDVVIFLDAHCEVETNWLPALLAPIHENRKTLSVPIIDGINWDDFSINPVYAAGSHSRGLFEWGMLYKEGTVPMKEQNKRRYHSEPYNAPTHAGGLFAIDREWFKELGWYDPGLYIWGGENFELSFKTWMCGGRSVWVPCSRVAHVYRGHSCSSCHSGSLGNKFNGQPTTMRNYKRVIETWFDDEYKEYFYTREPLARYVDMGDISEQLALKKKLNCKSFDWFMKEVAYDVFDKYPRLPPNDKWGEIKNEAANQCIDTRGKHPPEKTMTSGCHGFGGNQMFRLNTKGQLTSGEWCQDADRNGDVIIKWCDNGSVSGPWTFKSEHKQMYHTKRKQCLAMEPQSNKLIMRDCDNNNSYQKWIWKELKPYWAKA